MNNDKNLDNYGFLDDDISDRKTKDDSVLDLVEKLISNLIDSAPSDIKWPNRKDELTILLKQLKDYRK